MLTKQVFALLALGGELRAVRTFPHPYHYLAILPDFESAEITDDDVIRLLAEGRIAAPPASAICDDYAYRIADPVWMRREALHGYKVGFGQCPACKCFPLAVTAQGVAPRHGHSPRTPFSEAVPACEGSGKPLIRVVSHAPLTEQAA